MAYFRKTQIFIVLAASFGAAYSQSVVIDGGNIRVEASPGTTKGDKATASKKGKTEVIAGDSESTVAIDGKNVATTNVGRSGGVATGGKGGKVFVNTDFSGQDLSRGNYAGASFTNVEAVGVNFRGVDLSRAVMTNMDLSNADLRGANLAGAQMTNVDWEGALLDGAIWVDGRRCGPSSVGRCK